MIPLDTLAMFFAASLLLGLSPGPDNIFVLTQSALRGAVAGLIVTLGLSTGLVVHTTAVALGVAAIFQASVLAFTALKLIGAAYLVYLAWHAFRASAVGVTSEGNRDVGDITNGQLYRRGIIMNVTNPKVSIFFLAFLPQFADPARGSLSLQMMLLGGVFIISTLLVFGGVALLAGTLGEWLKHSDKAQRVINRVAGTVFILLALKLASAER
ncbi:MAG: LysE family translocator [Rhodocyclaceae bacterium]|nr:MAG: LysE family translocator [Rhodocyclaceae bacterium]